MSSIQSINGYNIYDYFIAGAHRLIYSEKNLNRINVFPVADGDTGTNLALTMKMIIMKSKKDEAVHKVLDSMSEIAVENAYGNSGMIFAQFLNGFAIEAQEKESLTAEEFADIARKAADHAYNAVGSPKEGTILSVMRDWATELVQTIRSADFEQIFHQSVDKARKFVDNTKYKMKVFMENNVVDAGAKAFLIFLEGVLDSIRGDVTHSDTMLDDLDLNVHENVLTPVEITQNRYCSQFYIETDDPDAVKQAIAPLGDSMVMTGRDRKYKIHIHTDHPDQVMDHLIALGSVLTQNIEDMKIESDILHHRKHPIGIVTDSIADIPQALIDDAQITVIPVNLICDSTVYLDKVTMKPQPFYDKMNDFQMNPTSAQPSGMVFERTFQSLLHAFDSVIGIFVSKKMSGTYQSALRVARKLAHQGHKIDIIDSMLNSNAQGLLVQLAADLIAQDLDHETVVEKLNDLRQNIRIYVSVADLTPMIKGGRIPKTAGIVLKKLKLQPVVSIDNKGKGIVFKKTFSRKAAVSRILDEVRRDLRAEGIRNYSVVYSDSRDDVTRFAKQLESIIGQAPDYISPISPVIGLNTGRGAFAVAYVKGAVH